jgi:hypothetical protein
MSWHFNQCVNLPCLQEQEEASWADTSLDGAPSALLSMLPTREASCLPDNGTECCHPSPCGTMCAPSTGSPGADTLTSLPEASLAKTSALPEKAMDLTESEADCGPKWPGSLARYNPGSRSWRTAQCSLLGGLTVYSATFPRWGMMRSGELWELPTPVLRIEGKGSGYWPTPVANDWSSPKRNKPQKGGSPLREVVANTPSGNWPTPTCADAFTDKLKSSQQQEGSMHSVNLSQAVKMWPTPCASDNRDRGNMSDPAIQRRVEIGKQVGLSMAVKEKGGSEQLNPDWTEWLMGWPVSWSSLTPLSHEHFNEWMARTKAGATRIQADILRRMRNQGQPAQAPQGPEQAEQRAGEHCDTVLAMPCEGAREGGRLGEGQCSTAPMSDMRNGLPVEQDAAGEGLQRCVHGEDGEAVSGEAMGRTEQGEAMHELREDIYLHTGTTNDLQQIVREHSSSPEPWWSAEPLGVPRVATGIPKRADRLKAIGNGQVPAALVLAWNTLIQRIP